MDRDRAGGTFRSALAHAPYRRLLSAYALASAAIGAIGVVVAVALFERGQTTAWATAGAMSAIAPSLFLSGISGTLADRHDHRAVLRLAFAAEAILATALVLTVTSGSLFVVLALGLAIHIVWSVAYPSMAALVPRLVPTEDLAPANGLYSNTESIAWTVGPGLGGLAITWMSTRAGATLAAAIATVALVVELTHRRDRSLELDVVVDDDESTTSFRQAFVAGCSTITGSRVILGLLALLFMSNLAYGSMQVLLLLASVELLGMSEGGYGALNAAIGAGAVLSMFVVNRAARARSTPIVIAVAVLVGGLPLALLAVTRVPAIAVVLMVLSGFGLIIADVLSLTALQRNVPMSKLARVFGILDSLLAGAVLLGTVIAGPLASALTLEGALIFVGGVLPIASALAAPWLVAARDSAAIDLIALSPTIALLRGLPMLRAASSPSIETLAASSTSEEVPAGTVIIRQGDRPDDFYAIVAGEVEVTQTRDDGSERFLRTLGPGDGFGELGLIHGIPRTATCVAASQLTVVRVPGDSFVHAVGPGISFGGTGPGAAIRDYVTGQ